MTAPKDPFPINPAARASTRWAGVCLLPCQVPQSPAKTRSGATPSFLTGIFRLSNRPQRAALDPRLRPDQRLKTHRR